MAIRALESDALVRGILSKADNFEDIHKVTKENAKRIETYYTEKIETIIADARYGFISGALRETYKQTKQNRRQLTDSIDAVLTHKIFGFPIFFAFMFIMFYNI